MREIPLKVFAVVGLESGLFVGMGIILYHSIRVVQTATVKKQWHAFRSL